MPTDWDQAYREGRTPWDKGYAAPPLQAFLSRQNITGDVLGPGCGLGHDVRLLARKGASVMGMDLSPEALRHARSFPSSGNLRYEKGDFLELDAELKGTFDWVVEHTLFCALEPSQRKQYAESVRLALKNNGCFFAIFYRVIPGFDGEGPPFPVEENEIMDLFSPFMELLGRWIPEESYPSRPYGSEEVCLFQKNLKTG